VNEIFIRWPKKGLTFFNFNPQLTVSSSWVEEILVALFEIKNLSFRYPSFSNFELQNVNLHIEKGNLIGILGPNGAGKSTILKLLAGLLSSQKGEITFGGQAIESLHSRERAKKIAYVPQSMHFTFPLTVWEIVEMGRHPYLGRFEPMKKKDKDICERALKLCDALDFKDRSYEELSGGEKQRVLLASALAQTPQVLLLDEPTLSLDLSHQVLLFEMIQKLHQEEALTVIVATHELNLAGRFLDRLILMKKGKVMAEGKPNKVLTPNNIKSTLDVKVDRLNHKGGFPYFVPQRKKAGRR
jgi:iron complex transport system ATP-binding protein